MRVLRPMVLLAVLLLLPISVWGRGEAAADSSGAGDVPMRPLLLLNAGVLSNIVYHGHGHEVFAMKAIYGSPAGPHVTIGPGAGFERIVVANFVPLFLDLRIYPAGKDDFVHFFGEGGYTVLMNGADAVSAGGWRFSLGGGVTLPLSARLAVLFDVGYERQTTEEKYFTYMAGPYLYTTTALHRNVSYDIVSATVGISF